MRSDDYTNIRKGVEEILSEEDSVNGVIGEAVADEIRSQIRSMVADLLDHSVTRERIAAAVTKALAEL